MRKVFCIFSFFIVFFFVVIKVQSAESIDQLNIDSIKLINQAETDKQKLVQNYNEIAYLFGAISIDSSLKYSQKGRDLAKKINYNEGLAVSYYYSARAQVEIGLLKQALENYDSALSLFISEKDSVSILNCYRGMSYVASYGSSQFKSLDYNLKALGIAEKLNDYNSLSVIYNNIGTIYKKLDRYELALDYFMKTIELEEKRQNIDDLAISYSNVGILKIDKRKFKEAESDYRKILMLQEKIENKYILSYLYLSISGYFNGVEKFDSAKIFIDKAESLSTEKGYRHILARVYRRHGEMLFKQKHFKEAITYLDKCLDLSKLIGVSEEFAEIYKMKADAFYALGNLQEAYSSMKKANTSIDSLKYNKVAEFLEEFENQKVENELKQAKLEQALKNQQFENASITYENRMQFAVIIIAFLVLLIILVLYFLWRIRKSKMILSVQHDMIQYQKGQLEENVQKLKLSEENLLKLNATKDKFFSIIAHDLKSPFHSLLGFNELLIEEVESNNFEEARNFAFQINQVLEQSLALLNNLLYWSLDKTGGLKFKKEKINLNELIDEQIEYFRKIAVSSKIAIDVDMNGSLELMADRNMLHTIFRNLVSNAIKYTPSDGRIIIVASANETETKISIIDTGIGINSETLGRLFKIEENVSTVGLHNEKGTGLGLLLCKDFVEKHKGNIWVESEVGMGSVFSFTIPHDSK